MSAGAYAAGLGAAGHDPLASPSSPSVVQPLSVLYDPRTRALRLLSSGLFETTHPVDQAAVLALSTALGSVASLPAEGSGVLRVSHAGRTLEAEVAEHVRTSLARLIARGDVELIAVRVERREGGFVHEVDYRNRRLLESPPRTLVFG